MAVQGSEADFRAIRYNLLHDFFGYTWAITATNQTLTPQQVATWRNSFTGAKS